MRCQTFPGSPAGLYLALFLSYGGTMYCREIAYTDIYEAFAPFTGLPFAHLLGGGQKAQHSWGGDWRIIATNPAETLLVRNDTVFRNGDILGAVSDHPPFEVLKSMLEARQASGASPLGLPDDMVPPSFLSGAVGHVSYEAAAWLEPVLDLLVSDGKLPQLAFGFYDALALFHARTQRAFLVGNTQAALEQFEAVFSQRGEEPSVTWPAATEPSVSHTASSYMEAVDLCQAYILKGDIFQANISQRLSAQYEDSRLSNLDVSSIMRKMQANSAASFGALLQYEEAAVLSNSPERFFCVHRDGEDHHVVAEPVKGTRPRHKDPAKDRLIAEQLVKDEKDRAENIMIADLVRNDLSRVCRDHSIREEKICELQSFAHVHHLVSRISGQLREGHPALDVLKASFPCGSITGAPKIRAMEIIAEIEERPRGIYCGTIGYIDDRGGADFSVPIRTVELDQRGNSVTMQYGAGGGITILSDPAEEYQETLDKAATFRDLTGSGG